ncbi:CHAT domain-containing protein [Planktothrix sp. FACHB-1355]|uniref:CHAT domain-containing protein n=1 Tax=Aerosakkonema funiforme FACHB-1375 TaxID=2949571 RepID=A0A926ZHU9_9CYAN|nr:MULTISPECIES: CHAT domain-containing protein [Oscillatoriales]MBD2183698.1 CHAT domain-containing protein [Aerosakkonema funiforme FACHB-1375]MBD3560038.1 CHAT domain-containing protein [Planktothrix sp. FACHB-1355]
MILLVLVTVLLCIVAEPIFGKVPYINQLNHREKISRNSIETARDSQADGFYRRACTSLLQALGRSNIGCKNLIRDGMSERVKEFFPILPATPHRAIALRNLGDVLRMVGALKTSQKVLEQSLEIANYLSLNEEIGASHFSLGNTKRALGKRAQNFQEKQKSENYYKEALQHYALAIAKSSSDSLDLRAKLNEFSLSIENYPGSNLDELWQEIKEQVEKLPANLEAVYARIYLAESLTCLKLQKMGKEERSNLSFPLPPLANLCMKEKETNTLLSQPPEWEYIGKLLTIAAQQAERLKDARSQSYALVNLGEIYEINQQLSDAKEIAEKALVIVKSHLLNEIAYRLEWQLGRLSLKMQNDPKRAIVAYSGAVDYLKFLRKDLAALNPDLQFNFRDEVEPIYRQLVELLLEPEADRNELSQANLVLARQAIEDLQLAELDNFLRDACADAKPEQIDKILDRDDVTAAAIYPIILPNKLAVILKLPQEELHYYSVSIHSSEVKKVLKELLAELKKYYPSSQVKELSAQVYDWLIRPAELELKKSGVKTLVFVLDGELRNIPMAALYDRKQYLIENYAIALAPGLQLLKSQPTARKKLKVLGAGVSAEQLIDGQKFLPLPNVKTELEEVKKNIPTEILLDRDFTNINLQLQLNSKPFSVVHIATHGEFSSNPERTYIVAWGKRLEVTDLDNLLQTRNQRESQNIELLILSACETAKGDTRATLGLAGVAVRAGARSTIASLWRAEDNYTADLVVQFYKQLIANPNTPKTEALRQAQLQLIKDRPSITPYQWAPYILVGNWQ